MSKDAHIHNWSPWEGFRKSADDWGRFSDKWQRRRCADCTATEERPKPSSKDRRDARVALKQGDEQK